MKPLNMKQTVATIERGERRDMPHTPWPLVQPEPYRVPTPTRTPARISPSQPLWNSISGSAANTPHSSGATSRPSRNRTFSLAPSLPRCSRLAARPINAPPARDDQGVKLNQSTVMGLLQSWVAGVVQARLEVGSLGS